MEQKEKQKLALQLAKANLIPKTIKKCKDCGNTPVFGAYSLCCYNAYHTAGKKCNNLRLDNLTRRNIYGEKIDTNLSKKIKRTKAIDVDFNTLQEDKSAQALLWLWNDYNNSESVSWEEIGFIFSRYVKSVDAVEAIRKEGYAISVKEFFEPFENKNTEEKLPSIEEKLEKEKKTPTDTLPPVKTKSSILIEKK